MVERYRHREFRWYRYRYLNRVLIGTGHDDDEPDVAGVEGAPLDTRQGKGGNDLFRYVFAIRRRKELVWIGDSEHIQIQTLSRG